jgi:hypothetical protein
MRTPWTYRLIRSDPNNTHGGLIVESVEMLNYAPKLIDPTSACLSMAMAAKRLARPLNPLKKSGKKNLFKFMS